MTKRGESGTSPLRPVRDDSATGVAGLRAVQCSAVQCIPAMRIGYPQREGGEGCGAMRVGSSCALNFNMN